MTQSTLFGVDPEARHEDDFYRTPPYQTRALLRRLALPDDACVFEPCVGDGAIVREFPASWVTVTNDLVVRPPMQPTFQLDMRQADSWQTVCFRYDFHAVISNYPFNVAFDIVPHAIERAPIVACLLRLSWLEPTIQRSAWLSAHPPTKQIVLPRHDYRDNGKTDSVTSAWFIWGDVQPGIEIVGLAERDELERAA